MRLVKDFGEMMLFSLACFIILTTGLGAFLFLSWLIGATFRGVLEYVF